MKLPTHLRPFQPGDIGGYVDPPSDAIYQGPIGEAVECIEPETEASASALGAGILAAMGAFIGPQVRLKVGRVSHRTNTFFVQVGESSVARKGTTNHEVRLFMRGVDKLFVAHNFGSGVASGPALVQRVSDPVEKDGEIKSGSTDQRLFLMEAEWSQMLRSMERPGALLSEQIRNSYDGIPLENHALSSGHYRSTKHCISIFGAITPSELMETFSIQAALSGFANRFLYIHADSDKFLPTGGDEVDTLAIANRLRTNTDAARRRGEHCLSPDALDMWGDIYRPLKEALDLPAGIRPLLARRTDHVSRLALVYAVTEGTKDVDVPHLEAALAWVDHSVQTVQAVLGGLVRDPIAGKILSTLRGHPGIPATRSELLAVFGRNATGTLIESALIALVDAGLAYAWTALPTEKGGPPTQYAIATTPIREGLPHAA